MEKIKILFVQVEIRLEPAAGGLQVTAELSTTKFTKILSTQVCHFSNEFYKVYNVNKIIS